MAGPFPNVPVSQKGQLHCVGHQSTVLKDNYWNDPTHRELWVYTPVGYDEAKQYPVVIFLAGFAGTGEGMLARSLTEISLASRCDSWIAEGTQPFIAVFPDCMTFLGGSQFVNSPAIGNYADYLIKEIIPFVKEQFSTNGKIGLAGRSSGGYGALRLAMEYGDLGKTIQGVACLAGDMGFETAFVGELTQALSVLHQAENPMVFLQKFWSRTHFSGGDFAAFNLLCMSAAYVPDVDSVSDPEKDFPAQLAIDIQTGDIQWPIFQKWLAHDPISLIDMELHQENLKALTYLFLDAGRFDEYHLQFGSRKMALKLQQYDIPHIYEEFDGGHRGTSYRYGACIPKMVELLTSS